jgi:hypothetical protein
VRGAIFGGERERVVCMDSFWCLKTLRSVGCVGVFDLALSGLMLDLGGERDVVVVVVGTVFWKNWYPGAWGCGVDAVVCGTRCDADTIYKWLLGYYVVS